MQKLMNKRKSKINKKLVRNSKRLKKGVVICLKK